MRKVILIAWKDLYTALHNTSVVLGFILTPLVLTLVTGFAFGRSGTGELHAVPVLVVNQDEGTLGRALADAFHTPEMAEVFAVQEARDPESARAAVEAGDAVAAIVIPADFTALLENERGGEEATVVLYTDPTHPIGASAVEEALSAVLGEMATRRVAVEVLVRQLAARGCARPPESVTLARKAVRHLDAVHPLEVRVEDVSGRKATAFDWRGYMAPSMAVFFLMFTVAAAARTILSEQEQGTLARLLVTPSTPVQVLGGKMLGTFLVGLSQMAILVVADGLLFHIRWGMPVGVMLLVIAVTAAASGWGLLIAALARTSAQVSAGSTVLALIFSIAAGNFFPRWALPAWLRTVSLISPNAWALDGFRALAEGASVLDVGDEALALFVMAAVLLVIAVALFRRRMQEI